MQKIALMRSTCIKPLSTVPVMITNSCLAPWRHGQWGSDKGSYLGNIQFGSNTSEWYQNNIELPFFNYYLKGAGSRDSIQFVDIYHAKDSDFIKSVIKIYTSPARGSKIILPVLNR